MPTQVSVRPSVVRRLATELGAAAAAIATSVLLSATPPAAATQAVPGSEAIVALLNAERERLQLHPLEPSPELAAAAQAHADDMATRDYLDFRSPDGLEIEDWAERADYPVGQLGEKLLETNAALADVVSEWGRNFAAYRDTVFAEWARHLGVATARRGNGSQILYVFVVGATARDLAIASVEALQDLERVRAELVTRVNSVRAGDGLRALQSHPALDRLAQARALELLDTDGAPRRRGGQRDLADRAARDGYQVRRIAENGALGPHTVEEAAERWATSEEHRDRLLELYWTDVGTGVAFRISDDGLVVSWVQVLANRAGL